MGITIFPRGKSMTVFSRVAALGAIFCASVSATSAEELRFNNLYVIGDSLSDGGTYSQAVQAASGGLLPVINHRYLTNAPDGSSLTYAGVLARELGLALQPNVMSAVPLASLSQVNVGGTNYAEGGARVTNPAGIGNNLSGGITTLPLVTQVDRLLADTPSFGANDLIILWGGANDVFAQAGAVRGSFITPATAVANMAQAATELAAQVDRVKAVGAQNVIVITVPDIGNAPFGLSSSAPARGLLTALSNAFNSQLTATLAGNAVIVDSQKLLGAVQADPAKYGFTAPQAATLPACPDGNSLTCVQGLNALPDSEQRVFADGVHPTNSAHALFGQAAFAGIQGATQTGAISVATMTALRQQSLSLENRMNPTVLFYTDENGERRRREVGQIDMFASFELGSYESNTQQVTPGLIGSTQVAKLGFDVPILPNASIGAGLSFDNGQVTFDGDRGGFDTRLIVGALFGQLALSQNFYLNAAVGGGGIDVSDIKRSFTLGPARETYSAETSGSYRFARLGGGTFMPVSSQLILNPFAHYTHENVSIDGFTESNGAASLSYGETEYKSDRVTVGLSAIISPVTMPQWKFNLRGSIEHDMNDDPLMVSLGPTVGSQGSVSAPRPDRTFGYLSGSVVRELSTGSFISFTGSSSIGQSGTTGYVASLSYIKTF
jgi:outer membrane lipase/esterase